eukprot:8708390-Pyramimonas_sp.AAC.1
MLNQIVICTGTVRSVVLCRAMPCHATLRRHDRLGGPMLCTGTFWRPLGGRLGSSWGLFLGPFGASRGPVGLCWGLPGGLLGRKARLVSSCSPSWAPPGAVLGPSWAIFGASWAVL